MIRPARKGFIELQKVVGSPSNRRLHGLEVRLSTRKGKTDCVWHFIPQKGTEPQAPHMIVGCN